ncbi:hypothetical protein DPMN_080249 [Dreissena polymorpha]|uniref:Uncharacterized protein n=1 Tax=Dreissena polymorpha TaxID=45954 RepID=A0A9D4BRL9_DREPO|nr:hypothetical protein DPMN_080249 [Dreissena polymorpha]
MLVSSADVSMMRVGFLPVIPRLITERSTVRHCLNNFLIVRRQFNQETFAIWCDEGVFFSCGRYLPTRDEQVTSFFVWALSIGPVFCLDVRANFCEALA